MLKEETEVKAEIHLTFFSLYLEIQVLQGSKTHCLSVIKTSRLILYREIIAVWPDIQTKHINTAVWAEPRICGCWRWPPMGFKK